MRQKEIDFIVAFVGGLKKRGRNLDGEVVITTRTLMASIRNFYSYKTEKSVIETVDLFIKLGMFLPCGFNLKLTDLAKKMGRG